MSAAPELEARPEPDPYCVAEAEGLSNDAELGNEVDSAGDARAIT
jgi:hypothetical protein